MQFKLKALTPIWTGGIKPGDGTRLIHLTGIKGSIRWWYEAVVRGLGGYACDPTEEKHCKLDPKKLRPGSDLIPQVMEHVCPACCFFGCTGWAGKFNLRIGKNVGEEIVWFPDTIEENDEFVLEFVPTRRFRESEKTLLMMTFKLIVEFGALGGKLLLKPSETDTKNLPGHTKRNHLDYGIVTYQEGFENKPGKLSPMLEPHKKNERDWPDLRYFWFVEGSNIDRREINSLVNRDERGSYIRPDEFQLFLGGYIKNEISKTVLGEGIKLRKLRSDSESKKIFSFHGIEKIERGITRKKSSVSRCFGYVRDERERTAVTRIISHHLDQKEVKYRLITGEEVLRDL